MIKRESLQKKLAIAAMAGMLMLLLTASCVAQTPLKNSGQENCTNCNANASSSQSLDDATQKTVLSNASVRQDLEGLQLIEPAGIQNSGKLTYRWMDDGECMFYCLEVRDDLDDVVLKQCYEASDVPSDMDGYFVTPSASLEPGDYTWCILCLNCGDDIESDPMDFTVCTSSTLPGRATLVSPKDNIGSMNPTFVWNPVTGCTQYRLKVSEANYQDEPIFEAVYDIEDVFSDTDKVCFTTPELDLDPGTYRWWIQAINCKGEGPWSYYKSFRYIDRPPGKSTPISPRGLISSDTPIFTWSAASLATEYHVQVINYNYIDDIDEIVAEEDFDASKVTKGFKCSGSLGTLSGDDSVYYWRVQANNDASPYDPDGTWSGWKYFETNCAFKPGTDAKKARMG
ncbi:MAG: hypothetical protein QG575_1314 [Euryarchaeota archaeon]|nr:hypothetical protein [Euryarchaeota archaeon]